MASKVNVKFLGGLLAAVAIMVVVGGYVATRVVTKSGPEHYKTGQEHAAKGEWDKAAGAFAKAVNKERKVEYLKAWVDALEHLTPETETGYRDVFTKQYMLARRGLAAAQPDDAEAQKPALDLTLFELKQTGAQPSQWEQFVAQTDDVIRGFSSQSDKGVQVLRQYRGIARTNFARLTASAPEDAITKAREDLDAALSAAPNDAKVMAAMGDWYAVAAQKARERRDLETADKLTKESIERLEAFVAANKINLPALWQLTQLQMADEVAKKTTAGMRYADVLKSHHPRVKRLIDQALSEPGEQLDPTMCLQVCGLSIAANYEDRKNAIESVMAHALAKRPNNVLLQLTLAELRFNIGEFATAAELFDKLVKTPNLPMSFDGLLLFGIREQSLARLGACQLGVELTKLSEAEKAARELKDPTAQTALMKKAEDEFKASLGKVRATRDKLVELHGRTPDADFLDARIRFFEGDYVEARRLLAKYTTQRPSDTPALKLLAEVMLRQNQGGAARDTLKKAVEMNPADIEAIGALGLTYEALNDFKAATAEYERALAMDPGNPKLKERIERLKSISLGATSEDTVVRVLTQAQDKMNASPPDQAGAVAMVKKMYAEQDKAGKLKDNERLAIAQALMVLDDAATALECLAKVDPNNPGRKGLEMMLKNPDPLQRQLSAIDASNGSDLMKTLGRYQAFMRAGKNDDALKELEKAKAIDAANTLVISAEFDQAIIAGKMTEAKAIAEKAAKLNVDRADGAIFRIRIEIAEGRLPNAAALAQGIVDKDPLGAMGHRLLGQIRLQMKQPIEALAAFDKAIQIDPTNSDNIKGKIQALIQGNKVGEALLFARENKSYAAGDTEFAKMLLVLEGEAGNIDVAIDRFERQWAKDPSDRGTGLELVSLYNKKQAWEKAKPVIDAIKKQKVDKDIMVLAAAWNVGQRKIAEAKAEWEGYINSLPAAERKVMLYLEYSEFLSANNEYQAAIKVLEDNRQLQTPELAEVDRQIGDVATKYGDWQRAIDAYTRALSAVIKDENNLLRYRIIESTLRQADKDPTKYDQVMKLCQEATAKGIADDLQLVLLRAEGLRGQKKFAEAKKEYDRAVAVSPNHPLGFFKRAEFATAEIGRVQNENKAPLPKEELELILKDAGNDLLNAIRLDNNFSPARKLLALVLKSKNDYEGAAKLLAEGVAIDPRNGMLRADLVGVYAETGRLDEALAQIAEAVKISQSPDWHVMAGDLLRARGEFARAADSYKTAWDRGFRTPQLARLYTEVLLSTPNPKPADVLAILNDPKVEAEKWSAILSQRAKVLRMMGKTAESDADMKASFGVMGQDNPAAVSVFFQDVSEMYKGKLKEMVTAVEALKPAQGFTPQLRVQIIRFKLAEPTLRADGLADLDRLIADPEINKDAVYSAMRGLADLLYAQKAYESAAELYSRILKLKPDDYDTMNNYAYTLCKHLNKPTEALPLAEKAAQQFPNNANVLDTLGYTLLTLGRVGEAESVLLKAKDVAKVPAQMVPILIHLAQVELAKGNRPAAAVYLEQADREMARDARVKQVFQEEFDSVKKKVTGGR